MKRLMMIGLLLFGMTALPAMADEDEAQIVVIDGDEENDFDIEKEKVQSPIQRLAILRIDEYVVAARSVNLPLPGRTKTVQDTLDTLNRWGEDEKIGGILININTVNLPMADVQELRDGIIKFRNNDKKVMAFLNGGGNKAYLLATAADEIAMAPTGSVAIVGVGNLFAYLKGHYQMQGIEYEVITAGKYKYPGFVNRREPDRYFIEEYGAIFDSMYDELRDTIAIERDLDPDDVEKIIDIGLFDANQAQQRGLIDHIGYYDEYHERLLRRLKMKKAREGDGDLSDINSIQDFVELINRELKTADDSKATIGPKIAVLHARGPIVDQNLGSAFSTQIISRETFADTVRELRKNKSIKAVVMRVDSPGGSGYASDIIWKELVKLDEEKPLVVSMGSVAGSGGYYIACPARRIFAQPTTITGSIGVISIMASAESMFNRSDYNIYEIKRGERSLLGSPNKALSKEDRNFLQNYMNDFYKVFVERVATGRKMPVDEVNKVAQGRVWSGRDAIEIGLVDELGGLEQAIDCARDMANIPPSADLQVVNYPRPSSLGEFVFGGMGFMGFQTTEAMEIWMKANQPAIMPSFDEQLMLFSQDIKPLCWMAVPNFCDSNWMSRTLNTPTLPLSRSFLNGMQHQN